MAILPSSGGAARTGDHAAIALAKRARLLPAAVTKRLGAAPARELAAAEMLRQLGHLTVRLMTNNPDKVRGLERSGVTVAERVPLVARASAYNDAYLATKAKRFGHIL